MDESNVVPINQNTEIQQPAVAAESGEAGAGAPAPAEPVAATDSHAAANAELAEKLAETPAPKPSLEEREKALVDSDPELYVAVRGPLTQTGLRIHEWLDAEAQAHGFDSAHDAILTAAAVGKNGQAPQTDEGQHPGHAVIDEIKRLLKVQGAGTWLHNKLDELRNLL